MDWRRHYGALIEYGKEFGHCNVPSTASYACTLSGLGEDGSDYEYDGNLGTWLSTQRSRKKGLIGKPPWKADRKALLQALVDEG